MGYVAAILKLHLLGKEQRFAIRRKAAHLALQGCNDAILSALKIVQDDPAERKAKDRQQPSIRRPARPVGQALVIAKQGMYGAAGHIQDVHARWASRDVLDGAVQVDLF